MALQGKYFKQERGESSVFLLSPTELRASAKQCAGSNELHLILVIPMVELSMLRGKRSEAIPLSAVLISLFHLM